MGKGPAKRHSYLSANSLKLREDDIYGFSPRSVQLALGAATVLVLLIAMVSILASRSTAVFASARVSEGSFSFSGQFYKNATVQRSRGINYLISRDSSSKETSLWVTKLKASLSCGSSPAFSYRPSSDITVQKSCYAKRGLIYASDVEVAGQIYQINMTSEKPIRMTDAKSIFGSISIE